MYLFFLKHELRGLILSTLSGILLYRLFVPPTILHVEALTPNVMVAVESSGDN